MVKTKIVQMTDEDLVDAKLQLAHCQMIKDESDLNLEEKEKQLEVKLPTRLLDEDIKRLKDDLKDKKVLDGFGKKVDATEADMDNMNIALKKFKKTKELDIPARKLRQAINQLRDAKTRPDAPELQIKKLKKNIRTNTYEVVDNDTKTSMHD